MFIQLGFTSTGISKLSEFLIVYLEIYHARTNYFIDSPSTNSQFICSVAVKSSNKSTLFNFESLFQ